MKKLFLLNLIFLLFRFVALSQTSDSLEIQDRNDSIIQYLSPLEYAFMMHEETKFMLRVPAWGVGAELEILPYFTWMTQIHSPILGIGAIDLELLELNINSEFRYYYGSRKIGVRNMSGNYMAAGVRLGSEPMGSPALGYYAKWGMQRRILGKGLADIGISAGFNFSNDEELSGMGFFIKSPVALGLGFVFGERGLLDRDRLCPVVKCHEVEHFLFKINFSDLINMNFISDGNLYDRYLVFAPQIAAEKKLFNLPLSLNLSFRGTLTEYSVKTNDLYYWTSKGFSLEWNASARWYYNMGRRMRLGKGGNGLSGNYLAVGVGSYYYSSRSQISESPVSTTSNWDEKLLPFISTGIQRTLGKRLYFDIAVGVSQVRDDNFPQQESESFRLGVGGEAQIGIKF